MYDELLSMYRAANFYHQNPEINSRQHYMECLKHNYDVILKKGQSRILFPKKNRENVEESNVERFGH